MKYLNFDVLNKIDAIKYQKNKPFPYIDIANVLYPNAYELLVKSVPDVSLFDEQFGIKRGYGQKSHDKYFLLYSNSIPVDTPWRELAEELHSKEYRRFIEKMFDIKPGTYNLVLSWHYMPRSSSISPHCDTARKIGSQLFYLNTSDSWNNKWGGQTLALDDRGEKDSNSGPEISEFSGVFKSKSIDNNSFIFTRTKHSWHAVDKIMCPQNRLRKMFSLVVNKKPTLFDTIKSYIRRALGKFL